MLDRREFYPEAWVVKSILRVYSLSPGLSVPTGAGTEVTTISNAIEKERREDQREVTAKRMGRWAAGRGLLASHREMGGPGVATGDGCHTWGRGREGEYAWEFRGLEEGISPVGYPQCQAGVWELWSTCS